VFYVLLKYAQKTISLDIKVQAGQTAETDAATVYELIQCFRLRLLVL